MLIHGVGDSMSVWDAVIPLLPQDRKIISYDLRGHGDSPQVPGPYAMKDFVADHQALLRELNYTTVDVVGYSLGALIAQAIALDYPDTVRRLVLIAGVCGRTPEEAKRSLERLDAIRVLGPATVAKGSVDRWFTDAYLSRNPQIRQETIERMARLNPDCYAASYAVLATSDFIDEISRLSLPTLAIAGEGDVGSPPHMSQTIAETVQDGRWLVIPEVKHALLHEAPDQIAQEVSNFVR